MARVKRNIAGQINDDEKHANYPKITNHYCIPLCLKQRLDNGSKIDLKKDYKLINPNIHMLFAKYNRLFFDDKLNKYVFLKWDYSEKKNAGLCIKDRDTMITIFLSVPLLQYRPSKDLIETLLHEMIHAYLFIKKIHYKEKTHHGARFLTIMNVINYVCTPSKLKIETRHNFLSELNANKSHKWQCDGLCQNIILRPSIRPPGIHEKWWIKHERECGGTYKIIQFNKNKCGLTNDEWKQKKLLKKQEKDKKRKMRKEDRERMTINDDKDKRRSKVDKRKNRQKYKITME